MLIYFWLAIFILFGITFVLPLIYWLSSELGLIMNFKTKTKVTISIIGIVLFITLIPTTIYVFSSEKAESMVTVTEVYEVYKNSDFAEPSYYYVSTGNDNKLYELKANKVTKGDKNYVITRKYEDGSKNVELVVQKVSNLPSFNK